MDPEIQELKDLVRKNTEVAQETQDMVRSMRRSARWGRVFTFLLWAGFFIASAAAYYYYVEPYVERLLALYSNVQQGAQQAQGLESQISEFLKQFTLPKGQ